MLKPFPEIKIMSLNQSFSLVVHIGHFEVRRIRRHDGVIRRRNRLERIRDEFIVSAALSRCSGGLPWAGQPAVAQN
jgi:hypothetical protein